MKSQTKSFDTRFEGQDFTVIYELNCNGTKQLMNIIYNGYPIDIAEIHGSDQHEDFYAHIMDAMNNNAMSYPIETSPVVETVTSIAEAFFGRVKTAS